MICLYIKLNYIHLNIDSNINLYYYITFSINFIYNIISLKFLIKIFKIYILSIKLNFDKIIINFFLLFK